MSFSKLTILAFLLFIVRANAQSFDIEQTAQLIRPRVKLDSKYTFDSNFNDTSGTFRSFENSIGTTFPIKRSFKTGIKLDLSSLKIKNVIKNSISIKAYQILGTFKITQRQTTIGFDSIPHKNLYYANAGMIGLHLTKKYRILFYTANIAVHEQDKTLDRSVPRFSGVIGQYHIRGLRKSFYYGLSMLYSDGLIIPAPFIGGTEPLTKHISFNYTLPVQINLQYKKNKTYSFVGLKADGYRTGLLLLNNRTNLNITTASAFFNYRYRFTKTFQFQIEGGYNFYQLVRFDKTSDYKYVYPTRGAPYINATINIYFGKSLLEKIVEQVF